MIKSKGTKQWLSDPNQLDDKRKNHPAREFGHEPIVVGYGICSLSQPQESDEQVLLRLSDGLHGVGSCASSTIKQHTVSVEMVSYDAPRFRWEIKERGKIVEEGILA